MEGGVLGEPPTFPVRLLWDDWDETYDSFVELGSTLEFLDEDDSGEPEPLFTDADGTRYRIVVFATSVQLCVPVPADYQGASLRLRQGTVGGQEIVAEMLGERVHRALVRDRSPGAEFAAVSAVNVDALSRRLDALRLTDAELSWREFRETWSHCLHRAWWDSHPRPPGRVRAAMSRFSEWIDRQLES